MSKTVTHFFEDSAPEKTASRKGIIIRCTPLNLITESARQAIPCHPWVCPSTRAQWIMMLRSRCCRSTPQIVLIFYPSCCKLTGTHTINIQKSYIHILNIYIYIQQKQ